RRRLRRLLESHELVAIDLGDVGEVGRREGRALHRLADGAPQPAQRHPLLAARVRAVLDVRVAEARAALDRLAAGGGGGALAEALQVLAGDAAVLAGAQDLVDVDALLARGLAHGR